MKVPSNGDISDEMRDSAERSVEQARAAFDNFISAAQRNAEGNRDSAGLAQAGVQNISAQGFEYAGQNINAAFDFAKKLVRAKDAQEAMKLQAEFVREQFGVMQRQAKEIGGAVKSGIENFRNKN